MVHQIQIAVTRKIMLIVFRIGFSPWNWTQEARDSFSELKQRMISAPILGYPDPQLKYTVDTDASNHGVGSVLSQEQDNREKVIPYYCNTLSNAVKNYCVTH